MTDLIVLVMFASMAVIVCAVIVLSIPNIEKIFGDGYIIVEENDAYMEIKVYDERGEAKVAELVAQGYRIVGVDRGLMTLATPESE